MVRKNLCSLILGSALLLPASAVGETVALNPDHPDRYTVQKGDTLWDIAARFLREPWRWPEIWEANPHIENPHLIYPGDELVLTYREGEPVVRVRRAGERPTVRLSPEVRVLPLDRAIPGVPLDAIQPFLGQTRVVGPLELEEAPYIVSLEKEHLVGGAGHKVYVRGLEPTRGTRYTVFRAGAPYVNPDDPDDVLGYEAVYIGDAVLERTGDPATMVISRSAREVLEGDRLLMPAGEVITTEFFPHAPEFPVSGRIISVLDGVTQIGQHQTVVVDLGTEDGLEVGHVLAVYQAGETIEDPFAKLPPRPETSYIELDPDKQGGIDGLSIAADRLVREIQDRLAEQWERFAHPGRQAHQTVTLPGERAGIVLVFRPFERVSYALVVGATRPIHTLDSVTNP